MKSTRRKQGRSRARSSAGFTLSEAERIARWQESRDAVAALRSSRNFTRLAPCDFAERGECRVGNKLKPNEHFLPQHYLRQFKIGESKLIGIAKVAPFKFVGAGPIRGQCQKQNFYSDSPGADKWLGTTESDLAPVITDVVFRGDFDSPQLIALRLLAVLLHVRTKKAIQTAKVFPKYIAYEVIKHGIETGRLPQPPGGLWSEDMMDFGGVAGSLIKEAVIPCWMEMQTVQLKLLRAPSNEYFITSDNPVVILNEFCSRSNSPRSFAGFSLTGFQLVLPLSPNICLFFSDQKVYKIGRRNQRVITISADDVEILNALQVQTAETCLYFHDLALESRVASWTNKYAGLRSPVRDTLRHIPGRDGREQILHIRAPAGRLPRKWAFCRLHRRTTARVGSRRDVAWSESIKLLMRDLDQNPLGPTEHVLQRHRKVINDMETIPRE